MFSQTVEFLKQKLSQQFLSRLLDLGDYADFAFKLHGNTFPVHRFILAARSPYFSQAFKTKWSSRRTVNLQTRLVFIQPNKCGKIFKNSLKRKLKSQVDPSALKSIIHFIYTGSFNSLIDEVDECVRLAVQCRLPDLRERLQEAKKRVTSFGTKRISVTHSPFSLLKMCFCDSPVNSLRSGGFAAVICAIFSSCLLCAFSCTH